MLWCVLTGREEGQLWYPRKVAVVRNSGKFVVCDRGNERSRMQIFTRTGHFLKKIAIRYIDIVAGLVITSLGKQLVLFAPLKKRKCDGEFVTVTTLRRFKGLDLVMKIEYAF